MAAAKKPTTKRKTTRRRSKKQKQQALLASMGLFALGALLAAMLFVKGSAGWLWVRTALFGVFGASFWLVGATVLYAAVRMAQNKPMGAGIAKAVMTGLLLCGTLAVFSKADASLVFGLDTLKAYYAAGQAGIFGYGAAGLPVGWVLLHFCGRPAANLIIIVLAICAVMIVFGISPAEVWAFISYHSSSIADSQRQALADTEEGYRRRREQRMAARPEPEQPPELDPAEAEQTELREPNGFFAGIGGFFANLFGGRDEPEEMQDDAAQEEQPASKVLSNRRSVMETALRNSSRTAIDIDLGPEQQAAAPTGTSEPVEPVIIGPGGTFGMNPLEEEAPAAPLEPFAMPAPDVILPAGGAAAAAVPAAAPVSAGVPGPARVTPDPLPGEDADEWISLDAQPEEETEGDSGVIENLTSAALDKPQAAEQAAAALPAVPAPKPAAYCYPPLDLFELPKDDQDPGARAELKANAEKLVATLESFGVKTRILDISRGPSVTRYELQPLAGVKISRITSLADDIALNLAVADVRIEAPIPGKPAVGIEVPNRKATSVSIRSIFESQNFAHMTSPLTLALGKDIAGVPQVADLCKMPHLLIAGSTGSGKSVCVNSIIISFLYRSSPEDVKLILIDPKVVELAEYNGIPHLLMPVVTEPRKAAGALCSAVKEMERRYHLFAENNVRDIKTYNKLAAEDETLEKLPYIAIVIDELADLMMVAGKEVEDYICRIAQKARAAGMHLIVATQRPSVDVITGLIKANIPSRIAFAVSSQIDSRTILDGAGAEKLLGMGDMLFMPVGASKPTRIQGTYVRDEEISRVLDFVKKDNQAQYNEEMIAEMDRAAAAEGKGGSSEGGSAGSGDDSDPMLKQCVECVIDAGQASTSLLQRGCKLGYARAARIMDEMEEKGIIGPYEGAKPRAVLVTRQQWIEMNVNRADPVPDEI